MKKNETFKLIEENARRWESQREDNTYSLNLEEYAKEKELEKAEGEKFEVLRKLVIEDFKATNIPMDVPHIEAEESRKKRNEEWIKTIIKDPYVYEALQIIEDLN